MLPQQSTATSSTWLDISVQAAMIIHVALQRQEYVWRNLSESDHLQDQNEDGR
jgi:hypothetical protein